MKPNPAGEDRPLAAAILQLLVGAAQHGSIALLATLIRPGRIRIEELFPPHPALGESMAAPDELFDGQPRLVTGERRLPVAWTTLCGARPRALACVPITGSERYLVCASAHQSPDSKLMACGAETISRLLGLGPLTAREHATSQSLNSLVNNLSMPLIFVDSRRIEVFLNEPARTLLEMPREGLSNRRVAARLARLAADEIPTSGGLNLASAPHDDLVFDIERGEKTYQVESRWIDDGVLLGRLWLFRDVSNEMAAARMKDQLVATVSHELRTPLTAMIGALGLLQAGAAGTLTEQGAQLVTMARKNGDRLGKIVNDLLDMEKMQSGKMVYDFVPLDLARVIAEVVAQTAPYTQGFGVEVRIAAEDEPIMVLADESRIAQVLTNLISNAAKFSPSGSEVLVEVARGAETARIKVIDQGRGVSEAFRQHLFARFSQDRESAVTGHPGSGLGLAISRSIVEAHGGTIRLDDAATIGSTFVVELPVAPPLDPDAGASDHRC